MATGLDGSYIFEQLPSPAPTPDACTPIPSPPRSASPPATKTRRARVEDAIASSDVGQLRELASEPGGFMSAELRRGAWCVLLACEWAEVRLTRAITFRPVLLGVKSVDRPRTGPSDEGGDGVELPIPHKDEVRRAHSEEARS